MSDLKFALRQLLKYPGFTAVAALTLALGIGATTAITSVVRAALFDPLPMAHPERFLSFHARDRQMGWFANGLNPIAAREVEAATNLFRTVALSELDQLTLEGGDYPQPVAAFRVSEGFFRLTGVRPQFGRLPAADEYQTGSAPVLVLGHQTWMSAFGGDPAVIGRAVRFREDTFTVLGVMPPEFRFPAANGDAWIAWPGPQVKAGDAFAANRSTSLPNVAVQAELQPGVTRVQAQAWLDVLQARQAQADEMQGQFQFLADELTSRFSKPELRRTLWALLAMTVLVLLIAAANLANLQFARTESRRQELAVRAALGAGRGRVFRQLLVESLLLAALGGVAGLLVTGFGLDLLAKLLPAELPRLRAIPLDAGVLAVAMLVTLGTGVLFGLAPAWRGGRSTVNEALKLGGGTLSPDRARFSFTSALVVVQIALALVLLTGAGLMTRSVRKLLSVDPGFVPRNVLKLYPPLDFAGLNRLIGAEGGDAAERHVTAVYEDLQRRLAAVPGVEAVGFAQQRQGPLAAGPAPGATTLELLDYRVGVGAADPLQAMRARLKQGRWLTRGDGGPGDVRVLLTESTAQRLWPGEGALGKRLWLKEGGQERAVEIVGVVADLRENAYNEAPPPTVFRAGPMNLFGAARALVIRTSFPHATLQQAFERELKAAGAGFERPFLYSLEESLYWATAGHRTFLNYLLAFAGAGLVLSVLGLYGMLAFNVARRTREIGLRMALGAARREVVRLVVGQGMRLAAVGVVLGVAGTLAASRLLRSFLFGVGAHDPVTLVVVALLLGAAALLACWLPARRAAKVDPMVALRAE
jgi:predicted permease